MQEGIDELLDRALAGDKTAENKLFSNLNARFLSITQHRICNPQKDGDEITRDAEDIVQETLEILYRNFKQVKFSAGFLQYAFGILRNKIGDYFRKKEREEVMKRPIEAGELVNGEQPEDIIDADELRELIIKVLTKTNFESQRIIYALMEGYSAGGMIGILGKIPRGTLDNKIYRIRKELKKLLLKERYYE